MKVGSFFAPIFVISTIMLNIYCKKLHDILNIRRKKLHDVSIIRRKKLQYALTKIINCANITIGDKNVKKKN